MGSVACWKERLRSTCTLMCMVARNIHLVRHGEVFNPDGVLYGRSAGFGLSDLGKTMASLTSQTLLQDRDMIGALWVSPLQRTRESAAVLVEELDIEPQYEDRLLEAQNHFEGKVLAREIRNPASWRFLWNPARPSWGEKYTEILARMKHAIKEASDSVDGKDIVFVTHQLPIWMVHRHVQRERLWHNPQHRRCSLSSITTLSFSDQANERFPFIETEYREPASQLLQKARDNGAV